MGPTLFVDVSYNSGVVCSNQNMMALLYYSPVIEGQYYRPELQYIDVELAFEWVHTHERRGVEKQFVRPNE